jgi:hypothetical protein
MVGLQYIVIGVQILLVHLIVLCKTSAFFVKDKDILKMKRR